MIAVLLLVVLTAWFAFLSYTGDGKFDVRAGIAAVMTGVAAVITYISDLSGSLLGW